MDFFQIMTKEGRVTKDGRGGVMEIYPDFTVGRSKDLMVRGGSFYAIWDEERQLWSTDEYDVQRLVDEKLKEYADKMTENGIPNTVRYLRSYTTKGWENFRRFMRNISDNSHQLDQKLTFSNTEVKKTDYVSRRLPYPLVAGDHSAWDALLDKLYSPEEREKIEWTIGAIISGDSKKLQKFLVLYGPGGTGKSTILNIIQKLFAGYITMFEAKALVGNNNNFATEAFKHNPLVAIQHDGDLSKIEDNTKLNSIISHEEMLINEKYKAGYTTRINAMLLMGTNKPVKITDSKSGIIRRLIDVRPTGSIFSPNTYHSHMSRIDFELGAIAHHCLEVYRQLGKNYYNAYRPLEMMLQTDVFFNFVEANYDLFKKQNGISLKQAYALYKEFCTETGVDWVLPQYKFREELRHYFEDFLDRTEIDGQTYRSYYSGFTTKPFKATLKKDAKAFSLALEETTSLLDEILAQQPAQYANAKGNPAKYWTDAERIVDGETVTPKPSQVAHTVLSDLDTSRLHFVKIPENHIVIDFDLKDEDGRKSLERNIGAASLWPPTYAEFSKSGAGIHLHYYYTGGQAGSGDLARVYDDGIEIKVFTGDASLRRMLTRCNNIPIATINSGLPLKEKKVLHADTIKSEKGLRDLIIRNLRKDIHPGTKPSVEFIVKILDDAYQSGLQYDVTDLRSPILAFSLNSSNHSDYCVGLVSKMKFVSMEVPEPGKADEDLPLVFFDVEVFPNLFVVCWSYENSPTVVSMINPTPQEVETLFSYKLVGFNNRKYDNHMLWARYMNYSNEDLYKLSSRIINDSSADKKNLLFSGAYNLSYADVYDFSSKKQGLKKFQIELGLRHLELGIPWNEPVPEHLWAKVVEYCGNDVLTLKDIFKSRYQDFVARQILADLSGQTINDTTNKHSEKIIFGNDSNASIQFQYTDLSKMFPGYVYDKGVSTYRGYETGEGGLVKAKPGMYKNVAVLDVTSMHPTSIIQLNLFGDKYTARFKEMLDARVAIKRNATSINEGRPEDWQTPKKMMDGKLVKYIADIEAIEDPEERKKTANQLADALKIVINSVYGLTSAKFVNAFTLKQNKDNIVAKRGALFMIDLMEFVQDRGYEVIHIKTDSIKIPEADAEIITEVMNFGQKYGYNFEHEKTYDQFCLVNDAVYIAREDKKSPYPKWDAVGAQFQHPYVHKALFTKQPFEFKDFCETKQVSKGDIYIDFDSVKPMHSVDTPVKPQFIGKTGQFVPVKEGCGGGILYRIQDDKQYAVTGTKGYFWVEASMFEEETVDRKALTWEDIDMTYFERLAEEARSAIDFFGPFAEFVAPVYD